MDDPCLQFVKELEKCYVNVAVIVTKGAHCQCVIMLGLKLRITAFIMLIYK